MNPLLLITINALSALAKLKADKTFDHLKVHVDALQEALRPTLPAKADGSEWTDADVEAAKVAADVIWNILKAITGN